MNSALDQAITVASAAEATYVSDTNNVANIQTAIATAQAPLPAALAQQNTDAGLFNAALQALAAAATAAQVPVAPTPPTTPPPAAPPTTPPLAGS